MKSSPPMLAAVLWLLGTSVLLSSCTVYAPMQPTISTISQAHQGEISTSVQLGGRLEAGAVYSPLPHVLLAAAGTYRPHFDTTFSTRQWEAGMGTYCALGRNSQFTVLAGYGQAATNRVVSNGIFSSNTDYQARYRKGYVQLGLSHTKISPKGPSMSFGFVYRFTQVKFDALHYIETYSTGDVPLAQMQRHDILLYYRYGLSRTHPLRWQVQATCGVSGGTGSGNSQSDNSQSASFGQSVLDADHISDTLHTSLLASIGFIFCPGRKAPSVP